MGTSDPLLDRAAHALRCLTAAGCVRLFVACTPAPPDRQVSRTGHIFWGKAYALVAAELQRGFALALPPEEPVKATTFVVATEAVFPRPKKTILPAPRGDVDNLSKSPLDAITKTQRLWVDDTQVGHLFTSKRWAEEGEEAGVHLYINVLTNPEG